MNKTNQIWSKLKRKSRNQKAKKTNRMMKTWKRSSQIMKWLNPNNLRMHRWSLVKNTEIPSLPNSRRSMETLSRWLWFSRKPASSGVRCLRRERKSSKTWQTSSKRNTKSKRTNTTLSKRGARRRKLPARANKTPPPERNPKPKSDMCDVIYAINLPFWVFMCT